MKYTKILLTGIIIFAMTSCCKNKQNEAKQELNYVKVNEMATLWYHYAAERDAIYFQTYKFARMALDNQLAKNKDLKTAKKPAVVLDIDETVLDNSPQQLKLLQLATPYTPESWSEWAKVVQAQPLPGALEFTKYAQENGVEVFYVSNRFVKNLNYAIQNLKKYDFPNADSAHVFLKDKTSNKTKRRNKVSENYDIILLLGDNLRDFTEEFAKRDVKDMGKAVVEKNKNLFGVKYIIFPNPMYGEWERVLYNNSFKWSEAQKDSLRKLLIKPGY